MSRIFFHLGAKQPDYRTLIATGKDLLLEGRLIQTSSMVIAEQTHSSLIHVCTEQDCGAGFGDYPQIPIADGLLTNIPGQYLLIRTADCFPVLLYDPVAMAVGSVHSGREGTRQNIAGKAVQEMVDQYGCDPARIVAHVGAGICEDHYEVSEEIYALFNDSLRKDGFCPCTDRPRHLNLRTTIFQQLIRAGLKFINIENHHVCTYEDPGYFSYRRDKGNNRQINLIGITDE